MAYATAFKGRLPGAVAAPRRMSRLAATYLAVVLFFGVSAWLAAAWRHDGLFARTHHAGFVADLTYVDLPRITAATGSAGTGPKVRADIALEIAKSDLDLIDDFQPRIVDKINSFLGGLDPADLGEPGAMAGIRQELLRRVNSVGMPAPVHAVLFRQITVM